ncbi:zinc metalloprotease HtpX [Candidatus Woesebacteria bacterium RIFCSPHIGHO2_02_FULL_38_9]|uniref:Protease HtpX homolog n=1 Tax=Candidatus Woesebacteria bacterium RIFCSPHIGHO2_01_FULL_39_28 TaxID=1802496 RepID=A0A1F7YJ14_9BACT|nr:MAG: zinc metalloprotease HtpX [Candidatus Woesebacteria bacterium RIFCSPHIGHO2_01_FULL_39_28]OGM34097.1 MAG: zinc metalloprotease HtpX [Candidatus Woesebacteria bacterium RIFCSPHIGHO2_02_FULL_38_9]OGM56972.1 MAG: zinc metalloprotease HtpX [Candidatus Woesebacteria bacterium RIFCSPLOWO2_01_FULL_38_20]
MINIYEAIDANKRKSLLIVVFFAIFVALVVYVITNAIGVYLGYQPGGLGFAGIALIISGLISYGGYYFSDKIVLTISGARPVDKKKDPLFYSVVENLCIATGLPKPKLYVIEDTAPNAFATGRDPEHAALCATTGILDKLNRTELEGVIAHELSHIQNYDVRLMSLVTVMVGVVALVGDLFLRMSWWGGRRRDDRENNAGAIFLALGLVFAILSPIVAQLIQLAVSRRREFLADAGSVAVTRQPEGLILALEKISSDQEPLEAANKATAHLYIVNPFKSKGHGGVGWFANLFNTHPPIEERIKVLKQMM